MTERIVFRDYEEYEDPAALAASFVIEDGHGMIKFDVPEDYPDITPEPTYARSMTSFTPISETRKAQVRQEINEYAAGNVPLGQMLRTEYAKGVAANSTRNVAGLTRVLREMTERQKYRERILKTLETDRDLRESLYRALHGGASPQQRMQLLQALPEFGAVEFSRRSFSLDPEAMVIDEMMFTEVRSAMLLRGGEVFDLPQQTRGPKLHAVEALLTENIPRKSAVIYTIKHDLGRLLTEEDERDITVRLREKYLVMIDDIQVQDFIYMMRRRQKDPYDFRHGLLALQNSEMFTNYCHTLVGRPDTQRLSSIVYGFTDEVDESEKVSLDDFINEASAMIQESQLHAQSIPTYEHRVVSDVDIVKNAERIITYIANLEEVPTIDELNRLTENDPVLNNVAISSLIRVLHQAR